MNTNVDIYFIRRDEIKDYCGNTNVDILVEKILKKREYLVCKIKKDDKGKPYINNNIRYISWSYSHEMVVIAISKIKIGVDIEELNKEIPYRIVNRFFSEKEKNAIYKYSTYDLFAEFWTQKEAYLKYLGIGIDSKFGQVDIFYLREKYWFESFYFKNYMISLCADRIVVLKYYLIREGEINEIKL